MSHSRWGMTLRSVTQLFQSRYEIIIPARTRVELVDNEWAVIRHDLWRIHCNLWPQTFRGERDLHRVFVPRDAVATFPMLVTPDYPAHVKFY